MTPSSDLGLSARPLEAHLTRTRGAWGCLLGLYPWQAFLTLTFERTGQTLAMGRSPERTDKAFRRLIQFANEALYGPRWMSKSASKGVVWVRVQEAHRDGSLHYHAVLLAPGRQLNPSLLAQMASWWRARHGQARAEVPGSVQAVVDYLVKHAGAPERAEIDLSFNFRVLS